MRTWWVAMLVSVMASGVLCANVHAESSYAWGYDSSSGDGNPDLISFVSEWDDQGWLRFASTIHRSVLFTGEEVGVFIDTDWRGGPEYKLRLHQYADGQGVYLFGTDGQGGWSYDTSQNTVGGYLQDGQMYLWVHASQLWNSGGGVYVAGYSWGADYGGLWDYVPDGGMWLLREPTQVGGASGPGTEHAPSTPPDPPDDAEEAPTDPGDGPDAGEQPDAPTAKRSAGRRAAKSMLRKHLPRRARLQVGPCRLKGPFAVRCGMKARHKTRRWSGTATATLSSTGSRYTVDFHGRTWRTSCARKCRTTVDWP